MLNVIISFRIRSRSGSLRIWTERCRALTIQDRERYESIIQGLPDNMIPLGMGKSVIQTDSHVNRWFSVKEDNFWKQKPVILRKCHIIQCLTYYPGGPIYARIMLTKGAGNALSYHLPRPRAPTSPSTWTRPSLSRRSHSETPRRRSTRPRPSQAFSPPWPSWTRQITLAKWIWHLLRVQSCVCSRTRSLRKS